MSDQDVESTAAPNSSLRQRIARELRTHPFGYIVLAVGLVFGPILAVMIFPEAPPGAAAVGGLAFGVWAALSTVPQKFL
jgi:hypothetical protein